MNIGQSLKKIRMRARKFCVKTTHLWGESRSRYKCSQSCPQCKNVARAYSQDKSENEDQNDNEKGCNTRELCKHHDALGLAALIDLRKYGRRPRRIATNNGAASQATGMKVAAIIQIRMKIESKIKRKKLSSSERKTITHAMARA